MMKNITNHLKYRLATCCLLLCILLGGCRYDDLTIVKPNENFRLAGDFLKNNYDFSLLYTSLQYTGLIDKLNEAGPYTIIAPNNKAFNELGIQTPADIYKLNKDSLKQAMSYHIITRKLTVLTMPTNAVDVQYQTLAEIPISVSTANFNPKYPSNVFNNIFFSGSPAYRNDVTLVNGTLFAIDKVIKQYPATPVQNWLSARPQYSIFVSGLKKFGLWDELAGQGPFTIFAPDNTVFANAGITQASIDQLVAGNYNGARLFGCYIIYNRKFFWTDTKVFATLNNQSIYRATPRNDDSVFQWYDTGANYVVALGASDGRQYSYLVNYSNADISTTDNICTNGIIHRLPGILMKPENAKKN